MKVPKYTGPKKNHAAVFVTEGDQDTIDRMRVFHSQEVKRWSSTPGIVEYIFATTDLDSDKDLYRPCWDYAQLTTLEQKIENMYEYDRRDGRQTIFLGYVKDCE